MGPKEFYDSTADSYDIRHSNATAKAMRAKERKIIEEFASGRVLDIGCGTGAHLSEKIFGIDPSAKMLLKAGEKSKLLVAGNAERLPFKDKSFDTAICMFTVLNLCDAELAVREMNRVLKENGAAVVSVASVWDRERAGLVKRLLVKRQPVRRNVRIYGSRLHFDLFTKKSLVSVFEKNGFETLRMEGMFSLQRPYWGWFREFTLREKLALATERWLPLTSASAVVFGVFRKL